MRQPPLLGHDQPTVWTAKRSLFRKAPPPPTPDAGDSNAILLRRYVSHKDEESFRMLVDRHAGKVYSMCYRVLGDAHAAEDAAQAVFTILARKAHALGPDTILAGWLCQTAWYVAREARREEMRRQRQERLAVSLARQGPLFAADPEHENGNAERYRRLHELLSALPAKQRDAIVLRFLEGLSESEIAIRMG